MVGASMGTCPSGYGQKQCCKDSRMGAAVPAKMVLYRQYDTMYKIALLLVTIICGLCHSS